MISLEALQLVSLCNCEAFSLLTIVDRMAEVTSLGHLLATSHCIMLYEVGNLNLLVVALCLLSNYYLMACLSW